MYELKGVSPIDLVKQPWEVTKILREKGCNPFEILADLALTAKAEKIRLHAAAHLAQYVAPKLQSLKVEEDESKKVFVNLFLSNDDQAKKINGKANGHDKEKLELENQENNY